MKYEVNKKRRLEKKTAKTALVVSLPRIEALLLIRGLLTLSVNTADNIFILRYTQDKCRLRTGTGWCGTNLILSRWGANVNWSTDNSSSNSHQGSKHGFL